MLRGRHDLDALHAERSHEATSLRLSQLAFLQFDRDNPRKLEEEYTYILKLML